MPRERFRKIFLDEAEPYLKIDRYKKPKFDDISFFIKKIYSTIKKVNKLNRGQIKSELLNIIDEFLSKVY